MEIHDLRGDFVWNVPDHLDGRDLRDFSLVGANLAGVSFRGSTLTGVDLSGAVLEGADFTRAILCDVCLDGAMCHDAIFNATIFVNVSLCRVAKTAASERRFRPSLVRILLTWFRTV